MTALYLIAALSLPSPFFGLHTFSGNAKAAHFLVTNIRGDAIGLVESDPRHLPFRSKNAVLVQWLIPIGTDALESLRWLVEIDRLLMGGGELSFVSFYHPVWPLALEFVKWPTRWLRVEQIEGFERWIKVAS